MPKIFISYRRADSAMLATHLAVMLKASNIEAFVDTRSVDGGGPFPNRLQQAIEDCDVFVCLLGLTTLESEWVRQEIEHAHNQNKVLIPIFQERYVAPKPVPDEHVYALLQSDGVHILDLRNLYIDTAISTLAEMILKTPPSSPSPPASVAPSSPPPGSVGTAFLPSTVHTNALTALQRAGTFTGKRNRDWQPFVATFPDLIIPDMSFCLVPVGSFQMGSNDGHYSDEQPMHPQTIKQPYWIAQYPMTNAQWALAVKAKAVKEPYHTGGALKWYKDPKMANAPVVGVDWFMAHDFAAWLGCRLPTEREWEFAARGVESLRYAWGDDWNEYNPVWDNTSGGKPAEVTTKAEGKSWVDARHLIGNVWEWCSSLYRKYPYKQDDERESSDDRTNERVLRGGSWWYFDTPDLRAACRLNDTPVNGSFNRGFRVAHS